MGMWVINAKKPIIALAPMADYTDQPFCKIARQVAGANFVIFREMVSSEAIVRGNAKTLKMCEFGEEERPIITQIFGSDPVVMSQAVEIINKKFRPDGIDINMGCPVPKITNKINAGSALMKDPELATKIIKQIKKDNPSVILSVKTRLGWNDPKEIVKFAKIIEKAGAEVLTIHARTKKQGYSGKADWQAVAKVKNSLQIPVIVNGDIVTAEDMKNCLNITKADGIMIGRGALGNPWILSGEKSNLPTLEQRIEIVLQHAKLHLEHYGKNSLVTFRKHLIWYFKSDKLGFNLPNIKKLRSQLVSVKDFEELKGILFKLIDNS